MPAVLAPKRKRKRGAGASKRRARGGAEKQQRKVGCSEKHDGRLRARVARQGEVVQSSHFSIELHGSRTATGWHGRAPPHATEKELVALYRTGEIRALLRSFLPVYFVTRPG